MASAGELDDDRNPRKKLYPHPPPEGIGETVSVDEGVRQIWDAVNAYLKNPKPEHILLISAPPGSRKTSIGVELAEYQGLEKKTVIYCGPRHAHFEDVKKESKYPDLWVPWLPKQKENEERNQPQTCKEADHQNAWAQKGWNSFDYCVGICGYGYKDSECPWHGQGRKVNHMKGSVVYAQHNHIFTGMPVKKFDLMIVDECPKDAVERIWKIPWQKIIPKNLQHTSLFLDLLLRMQQMFLDDKAVSLSGATLINALGGWESVFDASDIVLPLPVAIQPSLYYTGENRDDSQLDYAHIWDLQALLKAEARQMGMGNDFPSRVSLHNGKLILTLRKNISDKVPPHVICLDATGNADLYQNIFDGRKVEVVSPKIALQGKVTQVWTNTWSISSLYDFVKEEKDDQDKKDDSKFVEKKRVKNQDHWDKAQLAINEIASRYATVGFISYKDPNIQAMAPPNTIQTGWFGAERGTNRFRDVDALIVFGTPMPPGDDIEATAKALYRTRMRPFKSKDGKLPWTKKRVAYQYVHEDGFGRAIDTFGYWTDPDLQTVLEQAREAEIFQALHRMRPLIEDKPVWLLTNIPTKEQIVAITIAELFEAPIATDPYVWGKVKAFARERRLSLLNITTLNLVNSLQIERRTAGKMMDALVREGHWRDPWPKEIVLTPGEGPGRQSRVILPC